jgi:hypothetical protein
MERAGELDAIPERIYSFTPQMPKDVYYIATHLAGVGSTATA